MDVKDILKWLNDNGIRNKWHSFIDLPREHRFATYDIPTKQFTGGDLRAVMVQYPFNVVFFYREEKTTADFELEQAFELATREAGAFSCETGYDNNNKLFYTAYNFDFMHPMTISIF